MEQESWPATADDYEIDRTIHEHIAAVTLKPRHVSLPPLLIGTRASEVGWQSVPADDPEVSAIVRENLRGRDSGEVLVFQGGTSLRVSRSIEGVIRAEREHSRTHAALNAELSRSGFRFPTSDECEYACGAGASTLFRWGDHAPCDRYPIDGRLDEEEHGDDAARGQEAQTGRFAANWNLHVRPNAFGIYIASNPYFCELVAEPNITRGGDGGGMICWGAGFFIGWLTLATAYFEAELCERDPEEPIQAGYTIARRVLPLD